MNKMFVLGIALLALIAITVWVYNDAPLELSGTNVATTTTEKVAAPTTVPSKPAPKTPAKGVPNAQPSFKSLLTQSGSYQCDYAQVQASGQNHNVIYLYGGKMRGEFRTNVNGMTNSNLFVYDGQYLYQWKEGTSVGTRTVLTSLSQLPLAIPKDLTSGAIVGSNYESVGWLCRTWLTNKSLLSPPSYVTF